MTEMEAILEQVKQICADHQGAALATVVKVEGSAYRRPGARMLIFPDGRRIGSISGGCLEADVVMRAQQVVNTGESEYVLYDSRVSNGDVVVELGCRGAVGILVERVDNPAVLHSLEFQASLVRGRGQGAMATVFRVAGESQIRVGDRLHTRTWEAVGGSLASSCIAASLLQECADVSHTAHSQTRTITFPSGRAEVLIEPIQPPPALLLCGAGQDAIPLANVARMLGWQVTILDHRAALLTPERFPGAETVLMARPECLAEYLAPDARTAVILMTHSYSHDRLWLQHLLPLPFPYIGLLGPRTRAERLWEDLHKDGVVLDATWPARLHSPVGLDIGSETPEEIALSMVAEIQAVLNDREGGFLRRRKGPMHDDFCSPPAASAERSFPVEACPLSA